MRIECVDTVVPELVAVTTATSDANSKEILLVNAPLHLLKTAARISGSESVYHDRLAHPKIILPTDIIVHVGEFQDMTRGDGIIPRK